MHIATNYDSAQGLQARLRDSVGRFLNFDTQVFDLADSADTRLLMDEVANGDGSSLYLTSLALPAGAVLQEIILPSGESLAVGEVLDLTPLALESTVQTIAIGANPLYEIVPNSNPPITRGEVLDRLYIPAYAGPVMSVPANPDPAVQNVHFFGVKGDKSTPSGRTITAVPTSGQVTDYSLVDKQVLTTHLDANGYAYLVLLRGVEYTVTAQWWGASFTFTVTDEDSQMASNYIGASLDAVVSSIHMGVSNSVRAQDGTVWQFMPAEDNGDGTWSTPGMVRIA